MTRALLLILVLLLTACATPQRAQRVGTPQTAAPDNTYTIDLPTGWVRQASVDSKSLLASRNGYLLESIVVDHAPAAKAFPKTKKAASVEMLPTELAELEIAEIKAQNVFASTLVVLENEPAEISGVEGYRLHLSYRNARGLELQSVVYGMVDASGYYRIQYNAPVLYYFGKYYPDFTATIASFQRNSRTR